MRHAICHSSVMKPCVHTPQNANGPATQKNTTEIADESCSFYIAGFRNTRFAKKLLAALIVSVVALIVSSCNFRI